MTQISARIPDELMAVLDGAARKLKRSRAEVIRTALEYYLHDLEDLSLGIVALSDPADPVFEWAEVRSELLRQD